MERKPSIIMTTMETTFQFVMPFQLLFWVYFDQGSLCLTLIIGLYAYSVEGVTYGAENAGISKLVVYVFISILDKGGYKFL